MGADGRNGAGMRWLVLTPGPAGEPALSLSKRGNRSRARGRSKAVQATLTRMFCPPLNLFARGEGGKARFTR